MARTLFLYKRAPTGRKHARSVVSVKIYGKTSRLARAMAALHRRGWRSLATYHMQRKVWLERTQPASSASELVSSRFLALALAPIQIMAATAQAIDRLKFDPWQFASRPLPVSSEFEGAEGFSTTGLSYEDYRNMHLVKAGRSGPVRRLETPAWVNNDAQLREILLRYLEQRAGSKNKQIGTPKQRLKRARNWLLARRPNLIAKLDQLCKEYVALKKTGGKPAQLKQLAIEIENVDTQIRFLGRDHEMALGVVYHYYRCGENSVDTGAALGMKPPHVRMVIWRLNRIVKRMLAGEKPKLPWRVKQACDFYAAGHTGQEVAEKFGKSASWWFWKFSQYGIKLRPPSVPHWNVEKAWQLRQAGMSFKKIAKAVGAGCGSDVHACFHRRGLIPSRVHGARPSHGVGGKFVAGQHV